MKTKKLIKKIKALLSANKRAQRVEYKSLVKVLRKLDKKEASLRERLDGETDKQKRESINHKLDVIQAQRAKGEKLKRKLEKQRDE
jgi:hypothetical protein